ncbi:MAG: GNAT family N-acetyltransferase [Pseudomonadota bacterium]
MHRLTEEDIRVECANGAVWVLGDPAFATMLVKERQSWLYLSKLAANESRRGQGLARILVEHAAIYAKDMNLKGIELETRVELTENHTAFGRMGFVKTGEGIHECFDRPTYIVMRR